METWQDKADWENKHCPAFAEGFACAPGSLILIEDEDGNKKAIKFDPKTLKLDTKVLDWHYDVKLAERDMRIDELLFQVEGLKQIIRRVKMYLKFKEGKINKNQTSAAYALDPDYFKGKADTYNEILTVIELQERAVENDKE